MPFGLTNAPATFQRFMNDIFLDLLDVNVLTYLDDIRVYLDKHAAHVQEVLQRLQKNNLFANAEKCVFNSDTVEYLGYILSLVGFTMDLSKIKAITDWLEPRKVKDIQSFLGFANFYRRFIHNYSEIVIPLNCLTHKGIQWNFSGPAKDAFNMLKKAFTTAPVLTHWIPDCQIMVETDASDYAIVAILSITTEDSE